MNFIYFSLFLSATIMSTYPLIMRKFKDNFIMNVFVRAFCLFIIGFLGVYFTEDSEISLINKFKYKNVVPGFLSQIRFLSKYYGINLLPSFIGIPLSLTWIIFSVVFDKILNNAYYDIYKYIEIGILLIGLLFINIDKLLNKKSRKQINLFAILLILISSVLDGYLTTYFRNYTIEFNSPFRAILLEGSGSAMTMVFVVIFFMLFKRNKLSFPSYKVLLMLVLSHIMFATSYYFNRYGMARIEQIRGVIFTSISVVLSIFLSIFYENEKLNKFEMFGIFLVIFSILLSIFT